MANENLGTIKAKIAEADIEAGKTQYPALAAELGSAKSELDSVKAALAAYEAKDIRKATIADVEDQTATGEAITPTPAVTLGEETLTKDTDYTLSYANNTEAGTATITVTGKGSYFFSKSATFEIVAAESEPEGETETQGE